MATGYYDANGVYIYGEDDNISLFSDLLNLGEESISDAITDIKTDITALEASLADKGCIVTHSTDQAIANNTATKLAFNTEIIDNGGYHDNSTNNTRITIPAGLGGLYEISAYIRWEANSTTTPLILLLKNTLNVARVAAVTQQYAPQHLTWSMRLNAGDYLELAVYHNTGSSRSVSNVSANNFPNLDPQSPYFAVYRVKE